MYETWFFGFVSIGFSGFGSLLYVVLGFSVLCGDLLSLWLYLWVSPIFGQVLVGTVGLL